MSGDDAPEVFALAVRTPAGERWPVTLTVWDPDPDDPAQVRLELHHADRHLRHRGAVLF